MKTKSTLTMAIILFSQFLCSEASAFYNPTPGRWLSRDPIGDEAFLRQFALTKSRSERRQLAQEALNPVCVFLRNDGLNHYDHVGLSGGDVLKMWAIFNNTLHEFCNKCIRCNIPWLGNVVASLPGTPERGCTWQAIEMHRRLLDNFSFESDDTWTLDTPDDGGIIFNHNWIKATSSDPNDPIAELDTWTGCMTVTFPNTPQASWKRCFNCPRILSPAWPVGEGNAP